MEDKNKKYPEGHFVGMWMVIGIAIFSCIGISVSMIIGNYTFIAIGPGLGVAVGLSIGTGIENKYKKEGKIRPLTEKEKNRKKLAVLAGIVLLALGLLVFLILFFFNS